MLTNQTYRAPSICTAAARLREAAGAPENAGASLRIPHPRALFDELGPASDRLGDRRAAEHHSLPVSA